MWVDADATLCLLHGTQHDIRHLPGAWKLQQEKNEARNIVRLDKVLRLVWPPLRRKDCALPLACRSSQEKSMRRARHGD